MLKTIGFIKPNKISYPIYQYDKWLEYGDNTYILTMQYCLGCFKLNRFNRHYEADYTLLTGFKEPTPFGKKWKGWFFQCLGLSFMFRKQIK
jgi:hypothetical protein